MCFYEVESQKIEKEKAMLGYLRFNNLGSVFRTLEFCFAIIFVTWSICRSSPYVSALYHLVVVFLRRLSTLIVNHHFVFLLGNGIIVTLFIKFGQFSCDNQNSDTGKSSDDDEFMIGEIVPPYHDIPPSVTVSDEKQIIVVEKKVSPPPVSHRKKDFEVKKQTESKRYKRSRSDMFDRKKTEKIQLLQRSETGRRRNSVKETAAFRRTFDVDDLSSEEFRQKVESVIEQHRRSLREESLFMVSA